MKAIVYPPSLTGAVSAPLQAAERRLLSTLPGPRNARPRQRDRLASQSVEFVFTNDELSTFIEWLDTTLVRAGAWFSAAWPLPAGGNAVRRFVAEPSYPTYYPSVGWRVSAQCEVRGAGLDPMRGLGVIVDLAAGSNDGATSAVGVTLSGLNASETYRLSLPAGQTHSGWSAWPSDDDPRLHNPAIIWGNLLTVTKGPGPAVGPSDPRTSQFGSITGWPNGEAARAAFAPVTITGATEYTFWLADLAPGDDRGGLSILVR